MSTASKSTKPAKPATTTATVASPAPAAPRRSGARPASLTGVTRRLESALKVAVAAKAPTTLTDAINAAMNVVRDAQKAADVGKLQKLAAQLKAKGIDLAALAAAAG